MPDAWAQGDAYEPYIGRWSRPVAATFVAWLDRPAGLRWVDVGCGTGALTSAVLDGADPAAVVGIDPSPAFVAWSRDHVVDPRARFEQGLAPDLAGGSADVVVSGLVLNFLPDAVAGVRAMAAAARGGLVAGYVWDYAEGMRLLRLFWDAAAAVDPRATDLDEARRFPDCRPEGLRRWWLDGGLREVTTTAIEIPTVFADFDELWSPFLGGQGPAPGYVASLDEDRRTALREELRRRLPVGGDGSIALTARAYAVRGTSPG